jgi:hypothetical protein
MSPVSRGRRKKRPTTRPRSARRVLPGLDGVHAELLGAFRPAVQATDPLDVEVLASDVLGSWWKRLPPGEDPANFSETDEWIGPTSMRRGPGSLRRDTHGATGIQPLTFWLRDH